MATTWNPANKSATTILSGGNLIATANTFNFSGVKSTTSKDLTVAAKVYYEVACNGLFADGRSWIGFGTPGSSLTAECGAIQTGGLIEPGTVIQVAGFDVHSGLALGAFPNKTYGVAIDIGAKKYWFTGDGVNWNAGGTANPATGVGAGAWRTSELPEPGVMLIQAMIVDTNASMTLNAGASAFAYGVPSGFIAWDATAPAPTIARGMIIG